MSALGRLGPGSRRGSGGVECKLGKIFRLATRGRVVNTMHLPAPGDYASTSWLSEHSSRSAYVLVFFFQHPQLNPFIAA